MTILIIVESPAKTKKIEKFCGPGYKVVASMGHIRDLAKGLQAIDCENQYRPSYRVIKEKSKVIAMLRREVKKCTEVIVASDLDREGEAIAFHICKILKLPLSTTKRIVFNQITKSAIQHALQNPTRVNMDLVNAQQARRVLDRLVGFTICPIIWNHIQYGATGGRCQSPTLRIVCEREAQIAEFSSKEYYEISGNFEGQEASSITTEIPVFPVKLHGASSSKPARLSSETMEELMNDWKESSYTYLLSSWTHKRSKTNPPPPYKTSTLQQDASSLFHVSPKSLMAIAQQLYQRGLITYHRTDVITVSSSFIMMAKEWILENHGESYSQPRHMNKIIMEITIPIMNAIFRLRPDSCLIFTKFGYC